MKTTLEWVTESAVGGAYDATRPIGGKFWHELSEAERARFVVVAVFFEESSRRIKHREALELIERAAEEVSQMAERLRAAMRGGRS